MLTDLDRTQCHVWLVNIAKSMWRRLSKCVFVPLLSSKLFTFISKISRFLRKLASICTGCH